MVNIPTNNDKLMSMAWQNECRGWLALGNTPQANFVFKMEKRQDVVCAWWQGKEGIADHNLLITSTTIGQFEAVLTEVKPLLNRDKNTTTLRVCIIGDVDKWTEVAARYGFRRSYPAYWLARPLSQNDSPPSLPPSITVQMTRGGQMYQKTIAVSQRVYGDPPNLTAFFHHPHIITVYSGLWRGEIVASAALWSFHPSIAGIYSLATLPKFRHRGLATTLINTSLHQAQQQGLTIGILRTVPYLIRWYEQLGFYTIGRLQQYRYTPTK